jgi:hypothetical protein
MAQLGHSYVILRIDKSIDYESNRPPKERSITHQFPDALAVSFLIL